MTLIASPLTEDLVHSRTRSESLDHIVKLNLWGLKLDDVTLISRLARVRIINISTNQLTSLVAFANLPLLEELYARANLIADLHEVARLKQSVRLTTLCLCDNPCSVESADEIRRKDVVNYRLTVIRNLSQLKHLDWKAVTRDERLECQQRGILLTAPPPHPSPQSSRVCMKLEEDEHNDKAVNEPATSHRLNCNHDGDQSTAGRDASTVCCGDSSVKESTGEIDQKAILDPNRDSNQSPAVDHQTSDTDSLSSFELSPSYIQQFKQLSNEQNGKVTDINGHIRLSPTKDVPNLSYEAERNVRSAVIRLLRLLGPQSLEHVIRVAEQRLI